MYWPVKCNVTVMYCSVKKRSLSLFCVLPDPGDHFLDPDYFTSYHTSPTAMTCLAPWAGAPENNKEKTQIGWPASLTRCPRPIPWRSSDVGGVRWDSGPRSSTLLLEGSNTTGHTKTNMFKGFSGTCVSLEITCPTWLSNIFYYFWIHMYLSMAADIYTLVINSGKSLI